MDNKISPWTANIHSYFALAGLIAISAAWCPSAQAAVPIAVDDIYNTGKNISLAIPAPGILGNDTDADGDVLTSSLRTNVNNGVLTLKTDGRFVYLPNTGFTGTDSFTYWVSDGISARSWATVTLNVSDTTPTAINDNYAASLNTALTVAAPGVLANDSDPNGDPLSASLESQPINGAVTLASDGSFTYTPNTDFLGTDTFGYSVSDGLSSASASVTITVSSTNTPPQAGDDSYALNQDTSLTITAPGVLGNDSDSDGDPLTATLVSSPVNGTLDLHSDGSFVYTPVTGYTGTDSFTYSVSDGRGGDAVATVTLTINVSNLPPLAVNDAYITAENTAMTVAIPGVLGNDSDPNGDVLTATKRTGPSNGTLTLKTDGRFVYVPNTSFVGTDSFTYWATDTAGARSWATTTITVGTGNNIPLAADDSFDVDQDTSLNIAAPGVLGNDTDTDGDPLTATLVSSPVNGTLEFNSDGSFVYTPITGYTGTDSFTYSVSDGRGGNASATVTLNVMPVLAENTPNFILLLTDDMRADDAAYMPHLQALMSTNSVVFPNAHTNVSLCCPARASILRGQYVHNHGIVDNDRHNGPEGGFHGFHSLGLENSTIATWMQAAGYRTALIGKYMNEYGSDNSQAYVPPGWDEWYAQLYNQSYFNIEMNHNGSIVSYGSAESDYATDVFAGLALDFVQRATNDNQPFFLYLTPTAPHFPYVPAPRHANAFPEITQAPRPPSFNEADVNDKPLYIRNLPLLKRSVISALDMNYRARIQMLQAVDEMIANLVASLEASGKLENTYFIFTSDSGTALGEHRVNDMKGTPYDENSHIPLMVRVPGLTGPAIVRNELVMLPDLVPTIAELAGASTDSFIDSSSFSTLLNSDPASDWRQRILLEYLGGPPLISYYYGLRSNEHLYVEYLTGEKELYDLQNDPYHLCNLLGIDAQNPPADCFAGAQPPTPELSQELATQLQALQTCVAADCATAEH